MSVVDMRAVDTMEGLTCTAMFSRGPSPRPAEEIDLNHLRARLVICSWYPTVEVGNFFNKMGGAKEGWPHVGGNFSHYPFPSWP